MANHEHHRCYAGDMLSSILSLKPVFFYGFIGGKLGNLPVLIICSLLTWGLLLCATIWDSDNYYSGSYSLKAVIVSVMSLAIIKFCTGFLVK